MAFNFNWSPLIADTSRARDMLTAALNKSPKPPIIVDDITVTELNLGQVPPELEILEIGDLAEDRFRGIFKMSYTGDAFLTLNTRVQANPLNTYLSTKPSFASPQPLAAASGLTIPLQITLSDIRLSGFVILVFSKQKGMTLVFRNDPLESLKVSSTFDSIPFIANYLQKEIEGQLRVLFMEDLPAILHRLSLRLWSPDYREEDDMDKKSQSDEVPIDPLHSPPQDPVLDPFGNPIDSADDFSLDHSGETHATFSQKNLLRLAALTESHRTLSLFTPSIRETVFRAWAGASERSALENGGPRTPLLTSSSLSRVNSSLGSGASTPASYTFSNDDSDANSHATRPTLSSFGSAPWGLSLGSGSMYSRSRTTQMRKRKKRVIDLRRKPENQLDTESVTTSDDASVQASTSNFASSGLEVPVILEERDREAQEEPVTPPRSPNNRVRFRSEYLGEVSTPHTGSPSSRPRTASTRAAPSPSRSPKKAAPPAPLKLSADHGQLLQPPPAYEPPAPSHAHLQPPADIKARPQRPRPQHAHHTSDLLRTYSLDKLSTLSSSTHHAAVSTPAEGSASMSYGGSGGILEQAWMLKMAAEIARKVEQERGRMDMGAGAAVAGDHRHDRDNGGSKRKDFWVEGGMDEREDTPPPAYECAT